MIQKSILFYLSVVVFTASASPTYEVFTSADCTGDATLTGVDGACGYSSALTSAFKTSFTDCGEGGSIVLEFHDGSNNCTGNVTSKETRTLTWNDGECYEVTAGGSARYTCKAKAKAKAAVSSGKRNTPSIIFFVAFVSYITLLL